MILDINTELLLFSSWKITRYGHEISWYHHKVFSPRFRVTPQKILFYSDGHNCTVSLQTPLCYDAQKEQICDLATLNLSGHFSEMPEVFQIMEHWQPKEFTSECLSWTIHEKMNHLLNRR